MKFNFCSFSHQFRLNINIQIRTPPNLLPRYDLALLCHDLHHVSNTHYSCNTPTAPLPLIPRRLAPLPGPRRLSTLIAPHVDPPSFGVILTRASPPTTPDPSDTVSTLVRVLPPTPHSSPSESVSQPVPPRRAHDQRFPAVRPLQQSTPTPVKADSRDDTPFAPRPDRVPLSYCHAIHPSCMSMPLLLPSHERSSCRYHPGKSRASLSSRHSKRGPHLPQAS